MVYRSEGEESTDEGVCSWAPWLQYVDVVTQEGGLANLDRGTTMCPQVSMPDDNMGRIYIPMEVEGENTVHIEFELWLKDAGGSKTTLKVNMDLVTTLFVSWCETDKGSANLAGH